jgi:ethanolamine utilization microcompartment shell protein EutL
MVKAIMASVLCVLAGAALADEARVKVASCTKADVGACFEYRNETVGALKFNKAACDPRAGHVWSETKGCPTEKRIAHCARELLGSVTQASYYPPATLQRAKDECGALQMEFRPD